jgi:hypothetical protein
MYTYTLTDGTPINSERLIEAVLLREDFPEVYLDTKLGALVEIPSVQSLGSWVAEIGKSDRYVHIERFSDEELASCAREFIRLILVHDLSKNDHERVNALLSQNDISGFENFLEAETDGWIHGWDQYIGDEAWDYVHEWLTKNPKVKITASFDGCGDCALCSSMGQEKQPTLEELQTLFQTEAVMESVRSQLQAAQKQKNVPRTVGVQTSVPSDTVFVFKISLNNTKPLVWRRIEIAGNATFFDLHCAIQNSMGWIDYHLHSFTIDLQGKSPKGKLSSRESIKHISIPMPEDDFRDEAAIDESTELLSKWFDEQTKQCQYTYDFGDNWEHTVLLEQVIPRVNGGVYPKCTAGKNACPPEDCGGVWGFENIKKILKNPKHAECALTREWILLDEGELYDPTAFTPEEVVFDNPIERLRETKEGFGL